MDWVTVFKAFNAAEAQLIRSQLEVAGFQAIVTNELSALSLGANALGLGGIRVQVPADVAEEARALVLSNNSPPPSEAPPEIP